MRKIGLLFGSFDPVHCGHISIAKLAIEAKMCDVVWLVLSPQNPLKKSARASFETRQQMIEMTVEELENIELSIIEKELKAPYYTINTIEKLKRENPNTEFTILCGSDIKEQSYKWHRAEELHQMVSFTEYPRYQNNLLPFVDVSSTEIRLGKKHHLLHPRVKEFIESNHIYNKHLEQGQILYNQGEIGEAINQWSQCAGSYQEGEASTLIEMAQDILAYRYSEIYNP